MLAQGESLSQFVENAVRETVLKRKNQAEFVRRGKRHGKRVNQTYALVMKGYDDFLAAKLNPQPAANTPPPETSTALR